ncbi:hypothetical protein [Pedobacter gandavensis]|uniref:hypothetical protein n=1 Tax=Pedobacter gandavensis TaxID=2679963 RepID=UPI00292CDFC7|nr:hypothetical protein [Pedobacter gandavensis]
MDRKSEVVVINNNTTSSILVAKLLIPNLTDSLVFIDYLDQTHVNSGEVSSIWLPYGNLKNLPASEIAYFYIFNVDSLEKYRSIKKVQGILKASLIRRFSIQLNEVKNQVDTVYVIKPF